MKTAVVCYILVHPLIHRSVRSSTAVPVLANESNMCWYLVTLVRSYPADVSGTAVDVQFVQLYHSVHGY
eukprot:SAG31_NODE_66_length_28567_cov_30.222698_20_plen_69_part_00